jgi:hypothetical protein
LRTHPDQYDRLVARLRAAPQTEPSPVAAPAREAAGGDEEELALAAAS